MDTLPSVLLSLQVLGTTLNWGDAGHSQALEEEESAELEAIFDPSLPLWKSCGTQISE